MTDEQIEELSKVKDEQIRKLTEMKEILKGKLNETLMENTKLRADISNLQLENQNIKMTQSKTEITGESKQPDRSVSTMLVEMDLKLNSIANRIEKNFDVLLNKLSEFLGIEGTTKMGMDSDYYSSNLGTDKLDLSFQTKSDSYQPTNHLQKPSERVKMQGAYAGNVPQYSQQKFQPSSFSRNTFQQVESPEEKEKTLRELRKSLDLMNKDLEKPEAPVRKSNIFTIPQPKDGVYRCPKCGSQSYQETENHDKILSFSPRKIYAKMYYCKKCRTEWEYGY